MPIYLYKCEDCGSVQEAYNSVTGRQNGPRCDKCKGETNKIFFSNPTFTSNNRFPYTTDVMAKEKLIITSRRQEREELHKRGLIDAR